MRNLFVAIIASLMFVPCVSGQDDLLAKELDSIEAQYNESQEQSKEDNSTLKKVSTPIPQEEAAQGTFHRTVIKAARNKVKSGELSRRDFMRLRIAMMSPAFRAHAEDFAVIQMAFSDSENVPVTEDGGVDRTAIDWDAIIAFIEKLIPLLIQIIDIFSQMGMDTSHLYDTLHACLFTLDHAKAQQG